MSIHLKPGSRGHKVKAWQRYLSRRGSSVCSSSGYFGIGLERATKAHQDSLGVFADGIVGPITLAAAVEDGFEGFDVDPPKPAPMLSTSEALAAAAGIPEAVLEAIREVESNGDATAIRFEPHIFLRLSPELRGQIEYTRGKVVWSTVASETGREAFAVAFALDPTAAVKSTSWGEFQVMGSHLLSIYPDPIEATAAFTADPEAVSAMLLARWFKHNQRARKAANGRPPNFAKLAFQYNGSGYARHGYHLKLAKAWSKYKR